MRVKGVFSWVGGTGLKPLIRLVEDLLDKWTIDCDHRMAYAERLGVSARDDEMWAHRDAAGRILEIELLGDDKPCQGDDGPPTNEQDEPSSPRSAEATP